MAHTRLITLNGSAGAFVAVSATQVTRRVEIIEDGSANGESVTDRHTCGSPLLVNHVRQFYKRR